MLNRIYRFILKKTAPGTGKDCQKRSFGKLSGIPEKSEQLEKLKKIINLEFPAEPDGPRKADEMLADLILLRLINENPASERIRELIDDSQLKQYSIYAQLLHQTEKTVYSPSSG